METWVGYSAAFCTTISFLPQAIKVIREKDASSLSLGMYIIFTSGVGLWLLYGFMKQDWALIGANSITFVLASTILATKIRYDMPGSGS